MTYCCKIRGMRRMRHAILRVVPDFVCFIRPRTNSAFPKFPVPKQKREGKKFQTAILPLPPPSTQHQFPHLPTKREEYE